jgi:hypothetical protein
LAQPRRFLVFLGQQRRVRGPLDSDFRIVPEQSQLVAGRVEISAFVLEESRVTQHDKAMCKTWRDVELPLVLVGKVKPMPPAESRRIPAQIDRDIVYFPRKHLEEFALSPWILKMQAA